MNWFGRRLRNRRLERRHVLDVKLRSRQVRSLRTRLAAVTAALLFGALVIGLASWRGGSWALDELVFRNPAFALSTITVQTDGVIEPDQIRRWAAVKPGDNLWALDLNRIRHDLELVPFVATAAVVRSPPHTLHLRITEREAIAQAVVSTWQEEAGTAVQTRFYLDATGQVMPPLEAWRGVAVNRPWFDQLPSLTGIPPADLRPGLRVELPKVHAALRLIEEFDRSPMVGLADLARVDLSDNEVLQIHTSSGGEVVLAPGRLAEQLRRWRLVHDYGTRQGKAIAWLDLSVSNNVPTRWLESADVPAPPARPAKPGRLKKGERNRAPLTRQTPPVGGRPLAWTAAAPGARECHV